jgi:hypothetical protein
VFRSVVVVDIVVTFLQLTYALFWFSPVWLPKIPCPERWLCRAELRHDDSSKIIISAKTHRFVVTGRAPLISKQQQ